jgi:membrane-bound lytic murein transglycosylase D
MPEQTKDYVLKIFSAAVIGQDPRHFGFDFDDPLGPYLELPAETE